MSKAPALADVSSWLAEGKSADALSSLALSADPQEDYTQQVKYLRAFSKIDVVRCGLKPLRVAIAGTSTLEQIVPLWRMYLATMGYDADIYVAPYGTLFPEVFNPGSGLYQFKPSLVWIFSGYRDVNLPSSPGVDSDSDFTSTLANPWTELWSALKANTDCAIIQNNFDIPWVRPFGNLDGAMTAGRVRILRRLNETIAAKAPAGVILLDIEHISAMFGKRRWHDDRFWHHSKQAFSLDALGEVAFQCARQVGAIYGQSKKCLVLDLDNTLWGGVIGDDGLSGIALGAAGGAAGEAFGHFQEYILSLKRRGIILTVCSKNYEETAREVFLKHPDMRIKDEDIALFVANWGNKADNISNIAKRLNIGLDSMVFVDDNPAERAFVRGALPMVAVPEMPPDPSDFITAVEKHCYFETVSFSAEDAERNNMYRENAERDTLQEKSTDLASFYQTLDMEAEWGRIDSFNFVRFVQLINKSNQFNLTTIRYSEAGMQGKLEDGARYAGLYFKLKDKFGDNGLISSVLLERRSPDDVAIETWVMSCRVLSRTMELFIVARIREVATEMGCKLLTAKYIPTSKNKLVADLYPRLGFLAAGADGGTTLWTMSLAAPMVAESIIRDKRVS